MIDYRTAWVLIFLIALGTALSIRLSRADDSRRQFFEAVKDAQFFDGRRFNCCGPGDATRAKVIGSGRGVLAVQIIDPMRHPTAKAGEVYTVPQKLIVKKPIAPESLFPVDQKDGANVIFFLSVSPLKEARRPFCLVQKRAGG